MKTVRYVGWPRDQIRTLNGDDWSPTQYGIMYKLSDKTRILIPWTNVIDITETTADALTVPKRKLIKPKG